MTTEAQPHATIAQVRQNMVSNCQWAVAHHNQFTYAEIRPWPITAPRTLPITTDCSGFTEMMARWSGAADPSGAGFNGSGNTDTMLAHSQHIPRAQLIIYPDSGHGALFQFPELFVAHGRMFLEGS